MKRNQKDKLDLSLNPITGLPNEAKRYQYPKTDAPNSNSADEPIKYTEIDDAKLAMIQERLRWKGARKIRGYRYKGTIPRPKTIIDYLPWLREE